ncbi:hypothetical protein ES332_A09G161300v1 [Gossypium tomentosum]|uniref:UBC core domain-containing protein n=1 Tax=Gossypium tomentosum TaxID=34277 RepID=A0A5D2P5S9_GOSTO|nr:hypothetical protein ES332_A09G161300v1 [Gossypium tomentosum]TYI10727.1 hypothetical protein ES332_A09G161300v1 [Gossypium tomentosum]
MDDGDDIYMRSWTGTIIGPHNTVHEGRIYQLKLFCDKDYPQKPKINMTCVNHKTGMVESKFRLLSNWPREYTTEDILTQLKKEMASRGNAFSILLVGFHRYCRWGDITLELIKSNYI